MLGFKDHYEMNKWLLMGEGDILLLHTDGLSEHVRGDEDYFPSRLESRGARGQAGRRPEILRGRQGGLAGLQPPGRRHQPGRHQAALTRDLRTGGELR